MNASKSFRSSRRSFLIQTVIAAATLPLLPGRRSLAADASARRFKLCLTPGSIGVSAGQIAAIELAHRHGFEAVEPFGAFLAERTEAQMSELLATLKEKNLVWGAASLGIEFRQDAEKFSAGVKNLPRIAAAQQKAGVTRVGTWLSPAHSTLTYLQFFKLHVERLRQAATILKDHGQRLGLEYVGTFTSRARRKFPFIHNMAEMQELIAEIGTGNVGLVLDSWHWWQAGDTLDDILTLKDVDVVSVDLNDAPANVPKDQQLDGKRELPAATGVIDNTGFLQALVKIGYTGPVRPEPFNKPLNDLENEPACAATIQAMRKAVTQAGFQA